MRDRLMSLEGENEELRRRLAAAEALVGETAHLDAALRESEARHRLLIESWAQAVWETDGAGVVVADSPSWRAYTGQTLDEWLGYGWLGAIHPADRAFAERQWRDAMAAGRVVDAEFRLRAPDGGWRWTNVRAAPVLDAEGRVEKWAGINIDIDARKGAEAALRDSEERLKLLVAELQHRTRNLLSLVSGVADETLATSDTLEAFGARFDQRLAALGRVQGLLSTGPLPSIGVEELLRLELSAHGVEPDLNPSVRLSGPSVFLQADTVQLLALALHELTTNALKHGALRSKGRLEIAWTVREGIEGGRRLALDWREHGVRLGREEPGRGFGRELIEGSLPYELNAETRLRFGPDGVSCLIEVALPPDPS